METIIRSEYIGGGDAAAVLGKNQYRPVYDVWLKKTATEEPDELDNHHLDRGNHMEPVIEAAVRDLHDPTLNSDENYIRHDVGAIAANSQSTSAALEYVAHKRANGGQIRVQHPVYPFIGGHPDGVGDEILWEFKCPAMRNMERIYKEGISTSWFYQLQHYMMITGLKRGAIAMWDYDEWEPYIVWFDADPMLHKKMLARYIDFWDDVTLGVPPIALNEFHYDQLNVISDDALDTLLGRYNEAYGFRYYGKNRQAHLKGKILSMAGDRSTLITENYRASIAEVDRGSYSYTRLTVKRAQD